jgi:hypothetical protein
MFYVLFQKRVVRNKFDIYDFIMGVVVSIFGCIYFMFLWFMFHPCCITTTVLVAEQHR